MVFFVLFVRFEHIENVKLLSKSAIHMVNLFLYFRDIKLMPAALLTITMLVPTRGQIMEQLLLQFIPFLCGLTALLATSVL